METSKSRSSANKKIKHNDDNQIAVKQTSIIIPSFLLKFQFPIDLWLPLIATNQLSVSIISVNSTRDEHKVMSKLSQTCQFFYRQYQAILKREPKEILKCFFMPTKTNIEKVKTTLLINPRLAFVRIENDKSIVDMTGRCFEGSLWQAAMQTKALGWLNWLWKEVIEKTNTYDLAKKQYQEKFGQSDERKNRMLAQLDSDLKAIEAALIKDPCTKSKLTLQETIDAFEMMHQHFLAENEPGVVIKTGEFFPLEIMQKIYEVYDKHVNSWNEFQLSCYSKFAIGVASRFFVVDDFLRLLNGFSNETNDQVPLFGNFKLNLALGDRCIDLDFTQPEQCFDFYLGKNFFVDAYHGLALTSRALSAGAVVTLLGELISNKNLKLAEISAATPKLETEKMNNYQKR